MCSRALQGHILTTDLSRLSRLVSTRLGQTHLQCNQANRTIVGRPAGGTNILLHTCYVMQATTVTMLSSATSSMLQYPAASTAAAEEAVQIDESGPVYSSENP